MKYKHILEHLAELLFCVECLKWAEYDSITFQSNQLCKLHYITHYQQPGMCCHLHNNWSYTHTETETRSWRKPFGNASIQTHAWTNICTQDGRTIQKHDASVAPRKTYNADTTTFRCNSNSNRPFIPLHYLCTHFWQLVHCNELLPTSLQQTPHGHLTAFCLTFWWLRCGSKLIVAVSSNNSGLSYLSVNWFFSTLLYTCVPYTT